MISLGCAKNQVDSELILSRFLAHGFRVVQRPIDADLVVINTCGFIGPAKEESIDTILDCLEGKRRRSALRVMVAGCLYQRYPGIPAELAQVDYWLTEPERADLDSLVRGVAADLYLSPRRLPRARDGSRRQVLLSEPGSAYLRISQGCDRPCAFCAIPTIKGPQRSRSIPELVADVQRLSSTFGVKEVNLVGQDLTRYGEDQGPNRFLELLTALEHDTDVRWFRLLYVYPLGLTPRVLEFLSRSSRFARYLDIPFQHSHGDVLKRMKRGGSGSRFLRDLDRIRAALPGVAVRTTMLVGHPGEEERHFEALLEFIRHARFEWMGVFPYSREDGTPSARMRGQVSPAIAEERAEEAMETFRQSRSLEAFGLGRVREALVIERERDGRLVCRTEKEAPEVDGLVFVSPQPGIDPGQMVAVRVTEAVDLDFAGEFVPDRPARPRRPGDRTGAGPSRRGSAARHSGRGARR